jgi:hypothetical protein
MSSFAPSMLMSQFAGLVAAPKGAPPAIPPIIIPPVVDSGIAPYGRQWPHPAIDPHVTPTGPPVAPPPAPSISLQIEQVAPIRSMMLAFANRRAQHHAHRIR